MSKVSYASRAVSTVPARAMTPIAQARSRMLLQHVFYGSLMLSLPLRVKNSIPTAATDYKSILYNEEFIAQKVKTTPRIITVLAHELMHVMFKHGLRRNGRHPLLWNIACDYAINYILVEQKFEPLHDLNWCYDKKYAGMSAEQIYDLLMKDVKTARAKAGVKGGGKGKGKGDGEDGAGEDEGETFGGLGPDLLDPEDGLDPAQAAEIERKIDQAIAQAATQARLAGELSGALGELVAQLLDPKVPWQDYLRDYMKRIVHTDESWSRRNRRYRQILPGRYSTSLGNVVFICDVSGSISEEEHRRALTEAYSLVNDTTPETFHVIQADTQVLKHEVFERGDPPTLNYICGGGTDMRVPLDFSEGLEPDVCILVTDGHTPWPNSDPPYPLIVLCTTNVACPVGQVIRV